MAIDEPLGLTSGRDQSEQENNQQPNFKLPFGAASTPLNPQIPEYAGGESLLKRSPGSSVSFSQSPGRRWKEIEELMTTDKDGRLRSAKDETPASSEPLSLLDKFLGIDPSIKALVKNRKRPAPTATAASASVNVNHEASGTARDTNQSAPSYPQASKKSAPTAASHILGKPDASSDSDDDDFFGPFSKKSRSLPAMTSKPATKQINNPPVHKTTVTNHVNNKDDDDDDFFDNLFRKTPAKEPTPVDNGISKRVQAALDAAQSPPPTPLKPSTSDFGSLGERSSTFLADSSVKRSLLSSQAPATLTSQQSKATTTSWHNETAESPPQTRPPVAAKRSFNDSSSHGEPRYSWSSREAPLNPLTQLKADQEPVFQHQPQRTVASKAVEDALWDDSDEEVKPAPAKKRNSKKKQSATTRRSKNAADVASDPPASPETQISPPVVQPRAAPTPRTSLDATQPTAPSRSDSAPLSAKSKLVVSDEKYSSDALIPVFENPHFHSPDNGPLAIGPDEANRYYVPESIARYLAGYQREGIEFMAQSLIEYGGTLLGDDMGLGKTVQVIALMAALLKKKGHGGDRLALDRREEIGRRNRQIIQNERDFAARNGRMPPQDFSQLDLEPIDTPPWAPILLLVPTNIVDHWTEDLNVWGHFGVAVYRSGGPKLPPLIESLQLGMSEILLCSSSMFTQDGTLKELKKIDWKLIIIDELHFAKNKKTKLSKFIRELKDELRDPRVIGLSGTPLQNEQVELWNLVDLVIKGHLGDEDEFEAQYGRPIKMGRTKDASADVIATAEEATNELNETKLCFILKQRKKEDVLKDALPSKDVHIVFCSMTETQKAIYRHILAQPDFVCLKNKGAPCDCGVNQSWFVRFKELRTEKERIAYSRDQRHLIVPKGRCCYKAPWENGFYVSGAKVHPKAVLWLRQHEGDACTCKWCPSCTLFPSMAVLNKVCSHASLIQVDPENRSRKTPEEMKYAIEMAKVFVPPALANTLPGGGIYRNLSETNDFKYSGKMKVLHHLLYSIKEKGGRALLFSESTQALDLIEEYIKYQFGRNGYLRMDGSTDKALRTSIAREFKRDTSKLVFLLSKKAFGTGLTLTAANYVIMFDTDWNPATDLQAQDRAFRIGQTRDVTVYRLVTKGTIEELRYLRQVYKIQLRDDTIVDNENPDRETTKERLFRAVAGDSDRKGELFGAANLLKFKDGYFHNYGKRENRKDGLDVHRADSLQPLSPKSAEELLGDDEGMDFETIKDIAHELAKDEGRPKDDGDGDDSSTDDEVMGGQTQIEFDMLNQLRDNPFLDTSGTGGIGIDGEDDDDDALSDVGERLTVFDEPVQPPFTTEAATMRLGRADSSRSTIPVINPHASPPLSPTRSATPTSDPLIGETDALASRTEADDGTSFAPAASDPSPRPPLTLATSTAAASSSVSAATVPSTSGATTLTATRNPLKIVKKKKKGFFFCGANPDVGKRPADSS